MTPRFRVWDGDTMHYFGFEDLRPYEGEQTGIYLTSRLPLTTQDRGYNDDLSDPMRYTGLDDSDGTPIYEADILEVDALVGPRLVVWGEDAPSFFLIKDDVSPVTVGNYTHPEPLHLPSTVIGNRYEDPEMLNESIHS